MKKIFHATGNQENGEGYTLSLSNKITGDKEGYYI